MRASLMRSLLGRSMLLAQQGQQAQPMLTHATGMLAAACATPTAAWPRPTIAAATWQQQQPVRWHGGCGHAHHGEEECPSTAEIRAADSLQTLQAVVAAGAQSLTPLQASAAFRHAAKLAKQDAAAAGSVIALLAQAWPRVLPAAAAADIANAMLAWTTLGLADAQLWAQAVEALPGLIKAADGDALANTAYSLAAMSSRSGAVPGVAAERVAEVLRQITEEAVGLVSGKQAGGPEGSGGSAGRAVSVSNLSVLRWAHEELEALAQGRAAPAQ